MKHLIALNIMALAVTLFTNCGGSKPQENASSEDTLDVSVADTTFYGVCGEGSMMSTLEVIDDDGKSSEFLIDEENGSELLGGVFAGDKMALTYFKQGDDLVLDKALNLTTLLGRWTSLDRNFTINEDGSIESSSQVESRPYTSWSICNAHLVLNADTFDVLTLDADSLLLEGRDGVYAFKRQK